MRSMLVVALGFAAALAAGGALAQAYPTKPVKLIVTYPPGGSSDLMARVFGQKLGEVWGQTVIIESKPGNAVRTAAGTKRCRAVRRAHISPMNSKN